jgi:endonuclease-3
MVKARVKSQPGALTETERMVEILAILKKAYPEAKCSLNFESPWQLMISTILSAQCTDERVNQVTPALFERFKSPEAMADAKLSEIEGLIRSTGFYKNKAIALKESSRAVVEEYGGEVPADLDQLTKLRGVGRKTANVVLGNAFGIPGLVVDTHAGRLSRRMGFTRAKDPTKVEWEMMKVVPRKDWTLFGHLMIYHGRAICTARRAYCEKCPVAHLCPKIGV